MRARIIQELGKILKLDYEHIQTLARVIELTHNATLVHDDVIDSSHTRRGKPTLNNSQGNQKAVILGDYMLAKAISELSTLNNPRLIHEMAICLKELVKGEWMQMENFNPYNFSREQYKILAQSKTGSLFSWCFIAPFISSRADSHIIGKLKKVGLLLGEIFQIQDDIIDFSSTSKKSRYLDFKNDNPNFVFSIYGEKYPQDISLLQTEEDFDNLPSDTREKMHECLNEAKEKTDNLITALKIKVNELTYEDIPNARSFFGLVIDKVSNRNF